MRLISSDLPAPDDRFVEALDRAACGGKGSFICRIRKLQVGHQPERAVVNDTDAGSLQQLDRYVLVAGEPAVLSGRAADRPACRIAALVRSPAA